MNSPDKLRALVSQGDDDQVISAIGKLDPVVASDAFMDLPLERQRSLFRKLSIAHAAALVAALPYYHAYVLLESREVRDIRLILEQMEPAQYFRFLDELPEGTWQELMDQLGGAPQLGRAAAVAPAVQPIIEAHQIEKSFERPGGERVQIIAPLELAVEPDTVLALLGPSGSGKSTLLRMLTGLTPTSGGTVLWHGSPLGTADPNIGIVFQNFALFPWLTVMENVDLPLSARGVERSERRTRVLKVLESVGLKGFEGAYPKELSGGMKQRVGFARALAVEPEVLFMDEPFSALDVLTAENLRGELLELWQQKRIPTRSIFLVTHNIEEAVLLADRVVILGKNPAKIRADFRVSLTQPRDRNSAEFLMYVDYIYKLMTQPQLVAGPPATPSARARKPYQALPHARRGAIAGLLELLNDRNGTEDLYRIADELQLEVDDLLPIVEAVALLEFANLQHGDLEITASGRQFAEAEIAVRKRLFREAVLRNVTLLQQMHSSLENKSDHTLPLEFFRDLLREHFTDGESQKQISTALNWGRYADLLTYDSDSDRISLYEPASDRQ